MMAPQPKAPHFYLGVAAYLSLGMTLLSGISSFVGSLAVFAEFLYPITAVFTAVLLLWHKPPHFIGFMWWIWFLTPEVRRLVDYQTGYTQDSIVMLTPFLVTGVALIAVLLNLTKLPRLTRIPLAFMSMGLLYAYIIGILNNGLFAATFDLMNWAVPVIGGAYILTQSYKTIAKPVQKTFLWGLLIMGVYGLVQFFYVPPWDGYWMTQALLQDGLDSIGTPAPFEVRVFSTLNAPGPFAIVMMAGLLLVFSGGGKIGIVGAAAGFIGFALSGVRSAWGGWAVGLLVIILTLPPRLQARLLGTLLLLGIVALPLLSQGPVGKLFSERLNSVTNLEEDISFNARLALYADLSNFTANNPLGQGLGSTGVASTLNDRKSNLVNLDSGIIAVLYTFGILGTLYFAGGATALIGLVLSTGLRSRNLTEAAYVGITLATFSQLVFGNSWTGVAGTILWFFPCLYIAARHEATSANSNAFPLYKMGRNCSGARHKAGYL